MRLILFLVLLTLILIIGAYAGSAVADAIRSDARQDAADRALIRRVAEQRYAIELRREQALAPARVTAWQTVIIAGSLSVSGVIIVASVASSYWLIGLSRARVHRANEQAALIWLDPVTRQFPLIPYRRGQEIHVFNPNTGSVISTARLQPPEAQMITASGATQLAGAIAHEAARARRGNGEAVAGINPLLVVESE